MTFPSTDRIASLEAYSIRLPRDAGAVQGTAGSPTALEDSSSDYRWSSTNGALYSVNFEAVLVKLNLESGRVGWGETQAPLAPDVACLIIEQLLRPALEGATFDGTPHAIAALRQRMYATMRVRGQSGGFMLDAMAGVDIALWDVAGQMQGRSVASLLAAGGSVRDRIPCYLSGLPGVVNADRVARAQAAWRRGFRTFKLFYDRTWEELLDLMDRMREALGDGLRIAVDAMWRLDESTALGVARALDEREALWLECPFPPESAEQHRDLCEQICTPIALGESYRSRHEMAPFLACGCVQWLQPDLGRWGVTETAALAAEADPGVRLAPHISIAMGPQIAAALHFAAACLRVEIAEYNPAVFDVANCYLREPMTVEGNQYVLPEGPGLGLSIDEDAVLAVAQRPVIQPVLDP